MGEAIIFATRFQVTGTVPVKIGTASWKKRLMIQGRSSLLELRYLLVGCNSEYSDFFLSGSAGRQNERKLTVFIAELMAIKFKKKSF